MEVTVAPCSPVARRRSRKSAATWSPNALQRHAELKRVLDPGNRVNPGREA